MSLLDNIKLDNKEEVSNPLLQALKKKQEMAAKPEKKKDSEASLLGEIKGAIEIPEGVEKEEPKEKKSENKTRISIAEKAKDTALDNSSSKTTEEEDDLIKKIEDTAIVEESPKEVKEAEEATEEVKDVEEAKEEVKNEESEDKETDKAEEIEEIKDKEVEVKSEKKQEKPKASKDVTEDAPNEEKPRAKAKKKATPKKKPQSKEPEHIPVTELPKTEIDFGDCVARISPDIRDDEWNAFTQEIEEEKQKLLIPHDMTTADMSMILSNASNLRLKLSNPYAEYKNLYDTLASRETDGLLRIVKKLNASGGNSDEREKFGIEACMNHQDMNLYELLAVVRRRYYYIKESYDFVKDISSLMITSNGNLKLQQYQNVNVPEQKFQ